MQQVRLLQNQDEDHGGVQIGNNIIPNRRIDREYEKLPGSSLPFYDFSLFRGIEETPEIGDKSFAGKFKGNFKISKN